VLYTVKLNEGRLLRLRPKEWSWGWDWGQLFSDWGGNFSLELALS